MRNWEPKEAYDRTDRLFNKLIAALEDGEFDCGWFATSFVDASLAGLPAKFEQRPRRDGHRDLGAPPLAALGNRVRVEAPSRAVDRRRRAPCADGRPGRTRRPRSATNSRRAGLFTGYYLHNLVQVRDLRSSDGRENVVFGPDVPPVVARFALTPAAAPLNRAVVPILADMNRDDRRIRDVLVDRGYSQLSDTGFHHPLRRAGMELIFQPKGNHQRLQAPFSPYAVVIDGQLFSALMPKHLWTQLP